MEDDWLPCGGAPPPPVASFSSAFVGHPITPIELETEAQATQVCDSSLSEPGMHEQAAAAAVHQPTTPRATIGKRSAMDAGLGASATMPLSERLGAISPRSSASDTGFRSPAQGPPAGLVAERPYASREPLAHTNSDFCQAWQRWCADLESRRQLFVEPPLTDRVMVRPLSEAKHILLKVCEKDWERPLGMLNWWIGYYENGRQAPTRGGAAVASSPARGMSASSAQPMRTPAPPSAPQAADPLQVAVPMAAVDRGEAGNWTSQELHCMSCALPGVYRRRASRASGVDQPVSLHRFQRCGCGASTSIVLNEHFPLTYLISVLMVRPNAQPANQPSRVPSEQPVATAATSLGGAGAAAPPPPVVRHDVTDVRCAGCSAYLQLVQYDPLDHVFQLVEYACPKCDELYSGTVTGAAGRIVLSLQRTRHGRAPGE